MNLASRVSKLPSTLLLWDVDHTLIENGGVSKATYAHAYRLLTGSLPEIQPITDGRTDLLIMRDLLSSNGVFRDRLIELTDVAPALIEAMRFEKARLPIVGYALPGAVKTLREMSTVSKVKQSVLTGNIRENAVSKLEPFGLLEYVDLEIGAYGSDGLVRANLVSRAQKRASAKHGLRFDRTSTILVGDTTADVAAGLDGGAAVIAVASGRYDQEELHQAGAHATLDSLEDVERFIETLISVRGGES